MKKTIHFIAPVVVLLLFVAGMKTLHAFSLKENTPRDITVTLTKINGYITGITKDGAKHPLVGVSVSVFEKGTQKKLVEVTSDVHGSYSAELSAYESIPEVSMVVTAKGYSEATSNVVLQKGRDVRKNFTLKFSTEN
jgi:hypothetical protein